MGGANGGVQELKGGVAEYTIDYRMLLLPLWLFCSNALDVGVHNSTGMALASLNTAANSSNTDAAAMGLRPKRVV